MARSSGRALKGGAALCAIALGLVGALLWPSSADSDIRAAGPQAIDAPRANERIWRRNYWVRADLTGEAREVWMARLDALLDDATAILQDVTRDGDTPCPVRLARGDVNVYRIGDPDFPRADRKRGELVFPGAMAGVYLAPGPGPSFASGKRTYVWIRDDWQRLETSAAWALVHEHGHNAGLAHLDVTSGKPCTLMSYGKLAGGCGGGRLLAPFQCEAYLARADEQGGPSLCLLRDPSRPTGVRIAPRGAPCSDGSGFCDARGRCRR